MQDQFYADQRDFWKWSVALETAGSRRTILYVAMYRPNESREISNQISAEVRQFFESELEVLFKERRCSRIVRLSDKIQPFFKPYTHKDRVDYFREVEGLLRSRERSRHDVVLLDPDTGIGGSNPNNRHVCEPQIASTWQAMRGGDALLVYQHNERGRTKEECVQDKRLVVQRACGVTPSAVEDLPHSDVVFFRVYK